MRKKISKLSAVFAFSLSFSYMGLVYANDFPNRDISVQVTFPPGGGTDLLARMIGGPLGESLGKAIVVENKPGASGNIAARYVARSKPDGHTLLMVNSSYAVNPAIFKTLPIDPIKDLKGVVNFGYVPLALIVPNDSPYNNIQSYLDSAKNSDKTIFYGSCGNGTPQHFAGEYLNQIAKINLVHVPYAGCGPAVNDVMANQIESALVTTSSAMPHVNSGAIKVLAITSKERSNFLPEVPTISEIGYTDYDVNQWHGLLAPKDTPDEVVEKIASKIQAILSTQDIKEKMERLGYTIGKEGPKDFNNIVKEDIEKYKKVAEGANLQVN